MRSNGIVLVLGFVLAACGGSPAASPSVAPAPSSSPVAASPSAAADLIVLTLGDSWPEGAHCGGCATFADRYAEAVGTLVDGPVKGVNLSGDAATDSRALLETLRTSQVHRDAVAKSGVIVIATGPNDLHLIEADVRNGTCGGDDGFDCIRELGATWATNFDEIVAEIQTLRAGQPTAIRLVTASNAFAFDPQMAEAFGVDEAFAATGGELIYEQLAVAMCGAAETHGAQCLDVRDVLGEMNENELDGHQAIADALLALGLPELEG